MLGKAVTVSSQRSGADRLSRLQVHEDMFATYCLLGIKFDLAFISA